MADVICLCSAAVGLAGKGGGHVNGAPSTPCLDWWLAPIESTSVRYGVLVLACDGVDLDSFEGVVG